MSSWIKTMLWNLLLMLHYIWQARVEKELNSAKNSFWDSISKINKNKQKTAKIKTKQINKTFLFAFTNFVFSLTPSFTASHHWLLSLIPSSSRKETTLGLLPDCLQPSHRRRRRRNSQLFSYREKGKAPSDFVFLCHSYGISGVTLPGPSTHC